LTLLNDVGMLEAASAIAASAIDTCRSCDATDSRLTFIFNRILSRNPESIELDAMRETYTQSHDYYAAAAADAKTLITIGQSKPGTAEPDGDDDSAERAALMIVASVVMNLDEAITHE